MATFPEISTWLTVDLKRSKDGKYEHVLGREDAEARPQIIPVLKEVIAAAHEDARRRLRALAGPSLDPLGEDSARDPAEGYPQKFRMKTLKGYFGEVMAGLIAENLGAFGHDGWEVPAYLFRFHLVEFQQLDFMAQTGEEAKTRPGRTGDDCLAFRRDDNGNIVAALLCEAKCTASHNSTLIAKAHKTSSYRNLRPVDLLQLIEILLDAEGEEAKRWVRALRQLYHRDPKSGVAYERLDQITYVCGSRPKQKGRNCWICTDKPHAHYTARRRLQVAEIHLDGVEELIKEAYVIA